MGRRKAHIIEFSPYLNVLPKTGFISVGPACDVDLGTNYPSAPLVSLTASLVGTAEM
jgi:hypothetical protein